jgi:hypothetical protein
VEGSVDFGDLKLYPLSADEEAIVEIAPTRDFDMGSGNGRPAEQKVTGGVVGIVLDARGRPLQLPESKAERTAKLNAWGREIGAYSQ